MVPRKRAEQLGLMAEKAFKEAVKNALAEHKRLGVPAVYMQNGKIVYLLPNGKVVGKPPVRKNVKK
jgi:hypothetical protein